MVYGQPANPTNASRPTTQPTYTKIPNAARLFNFVIFLTVFGTIFYYKEHYTTTKALHHLQYHGDLLYMN
jgi:hypothetical protein